MVDVNIKGIKQEDIDLIDNATVIIKRSRSNFMLVSSLDAAKKILLDEEKNKKC